MRTFICERKIFCAKDGKIDVKILEDLYEKTKSDARFVDEKFYEYFRDGMSIEEMEESIDLLLEWNIKFGKKLTQTRQNTSRLDLMLIIFQKVLLFCS